MTALRILDAVRVGDLELIPIARIRCGTHRPARGLVGFGMSEPVAVVVRSAHEDTAFRPDGSAIPIDQLSDDIPGLRERLERERPAPAP